MASLRDSKRFSKFVDRLVFIDQRLTKTPTVSDIELLLCQQLDTFPGLEITNNHSYTPHRASSVHSDSGYSLIQRFQALYDVRRLLRFHSSRTHETQTGSDIELLLCKAFHKFPCLEITYNHFYTSQKASSVHPDSGHGAIQRFQALFEVRRPLRFHSSRTNKTQTGSYFELLLCDTLDTFPGLEINKQPFLHSSQGQFCTPRQRTLSISEISSARIRSS